MDWMLHRIKDVPPGRAVIYGAGGRGRELLGLLRAQRPDVDVTGFVDLAQSGQAEGLPVLLLKHAQANPPEADSVLVATWAWERAVFDAARLGLPTFVLNQRVFLGPDALHEKAWRQAEATGFAPSMVSMQLSDACNFSCRMCSYVKGDLRPAFMDMDTFLSALGQCARLDPRPPISLSTSRGEPMLNPRFMDMLARAVADGFEVRLVTNGSLLDEAAIRDIADIGPSSVMLSFSGFDAATYEGVYRGGNFARTVQRIAQLNEALLARHRDGLHVRSILLDEDWAQAGLNTLGFLAGLGIPADHVVATPPTNKGLLAQGGYSPEKGMHSCWGIGHSQAVFCPSLLSIGIFTDGAVTTCACNDQTGDLVIGQLGPDNLAELIFGQTRQDILRRFIARDLRTIPLCRRCDSPYT